MRRKDKRLTHLLTHLLTQSLTHPLTHSPHSLRLWHSHAVMLKLIITAYGPRGICHLLECPFHRVRERAQIARGRQLRATLHCALPFQLHGTLCAECSNYGGGIWYGQAAHQICTGGVKLLTPRHVLIGACRKRVGGRASSRCEGLIGNAKTRRRPQWRRRRRRRLTRASGCCSTWSRWEVRRPPVLPLLVGDAGRGAA